VDAAFFVASPKSSFVRNLLATEELSLLSMERAEAYTRVHRFLSKVTLPEGVVDFRENIPKKDVHLLAASATLVIREDFHPALVDLILQAASEVHGKGGIFECSYQFPSAQFVDFPVQKEALRISSQVPLSCRSTAFLGGQPDRPAQGHAVAAPHFAHPPVQGGPAHLSLAGAISHHSLVPGTSGSGPAVGGEQGPWKTRGIFGRT
jgi:hypothetical protein